LRIQKKLISSKTLIIIAFHIHSHRKKQPVTLVDREEGEINRIQTDSTLLITADREILLLINFLSAAWKLKDKWRYLLTMERECNAIMSYDQPYRITAAILLHFDIIKLRTLTKGI